MSTSILPVPVHLQDDPDACGLACAQMVLRNITGVLHQQTVLKPLVADPVWALTPDQLRDAINANLPPGSSQYVVFAENTVDDAMERVAAALDASCPAVVLASPQEHWVVVHGITSSASSVTIHLRNPLPDRENVIGAPLPLHADSDICLDKDIENSGQFGGEVALCAEWAQWFMVKSGFAPVLHKYVVVAPTKPIPAGGRYRCRHVRKTISGDASIGEVAWARLEETDLFSIPEWRDLASSPPRFAEALDVRIEHMNDRANDFRLVRVANDDGKSVLIRLNEYSSDILSALLEPSERLSTSLFAQVADLPWPAPGIPPGASIRRVWSYSSRTFYSPYIPLIEVRSPGVPGGSYYLRAFDGKRFDWEPAFG